MNGMIGEKMNKVFILMAMFQGHLTEMGTYKYISSCQTAAKDYASAYCEPASAEANIYGTCWGCMHGCTWQQNNSICGTDPRPKD